MYEIIKKTFKMDDGEDFEDCLFYFDKMDGYEPGSATPIGNRMIIALFYKAIIITADGVQ